MICKFRVYLVCILVIWPLRASELHEVEFDSTVIGHEDLGVEISVKLDEEGNLALISLVNGGKKSIVPASLLRGSGKIVSLAGMRVITTKAMPASKLESMPSLRISFSFGKFVINESGGFAFNSRDEVWFDFVLGEFLSRGRCVSEGDLTGRWTSYAMEYGGEEVKLKTVGAVVNPFGPESVRKIE